MAPDIKHTTKNEMIRDANRLALNQEILDVPILPVAEVPLKRSGRMLGWDQCVERIERKFGAFTELTLKLSGRVADLEQQKKKVEVLDFGLGFLNQVSKSQMYRDVKKLGEHGPNHIRDAKSWMEAVSHVHEVINFYKRDPNKVDTLALAKLNKINEEAAKMMPVKPLMPGEPTKPVLFQENLSDAVNVNATVVHQLMGALVRFQGDNVRLAGDLQKYHNKNDFYAMVQEEICQRFQRCSTLATT